MTTLKNGALNLDNALRFLCSGLNSHTRKHSYTEVCRCENFELLVKTRYLLGLFRVQNSFCLASDSKIVFSKFSVRKVFGLNFIFKHVDMAISLSTVAVKNERDDI